jgi:hypothetical protein
MCVWRGAQLLDARTNAVVYQRNPSLSHMNGGWGEYWCYPCEGFLEIRFQPHWVEAWRGGEQYYDFT